ncbi:anthrone oxygenase family protein [Gryllotalpicola reticulitermitis]|uniref:Anthrone oxygenase family protein n=1 Tax=Gryllotalpicola reticulitermitis TaxID=1184153 RepID=A0ABV8Q2N9_9MICO
METALAIVTAAIIGTMVGVESCVSFFLNPIVLRLPAGPSLEAQADGARVLGRAMPPWYIVSLVLTVALATVTWGTTAAQASVIAVILFLINLVMSLAVLVPINRRAMRWTAAEHPADWREQSQRWNRVNHVRVGLILAAFILVLVATTSL